MSIEFHWAAIAAGTVVSMLSGMVWYHPKVFGDKWMKSIKMTQKQADAGATMGMIVAVIRSFILSLSLFSIIDVTAAFFSDQSFLENAVGVGAWVGIAIVAMTMFMHDTFEQRPRYATKVHIFYEIFNIIAVAVAIGVVAG